MGLHSPFGYVGYEIAFGEVMVTILDKICGGCHTEGDFYKGCHDCPAGQLVYACKEYLAEGNEADKNYEMYASEEWQAKRETLYGHRDSPEEIASNLRMAQLLKPEGDAVRGIKEEAAKIEPHPFFHGQWIWEDKRAPDPLMRLRELLKDLDFITTNRFQDWRFRGSLETTFKKRFRKAFDRARLRLEQKETPSQGPGEIRPQGA